MLDAFTTGKTAAVAEASTRLLLDLAGWRGQVLTSSRLPSRPGRSQRLADLAAGTGARAYLCGTGGMTYLDVAAFAAQSIAVAPFRLPTTGLWSSGCRTSALWAMATLGPQAVAACLQALAVDRQSALLAVGGQLDLPAQGRLTGNQVAVARLTVSDEQGPLIWVSPDVHGSWWRRRTRGRLGFGCSAMRRTFFSGRRTGRRPQTPAWCLPPGRRSTPAAAWAAASVPTWRPRQ